MAMRSNAFVALPAGSQAVAPATTQFSTQPQQLVARQVAGARRSTGASRLSSNGVMVAAAAMVGASVASKGKKGGHAGGAPVGRKNVTKVKQARETKAEVDLSGVWNKYGQKWEVHKFGGASLNDASLYATCGDLLKSEAAAAGDGRRIPTAAIVSAAGGMTDALVNVVTTSVKDEAEAAKLLAAVVGRQSGILMELVPDKPELTDPIIANFKSDEQRVLAMLTAITLMRGVPPQMLELVAGLGEVWSAQTLTTYLSYTGVESAWCDARDVLIVPDASAGDLGEKGMATDTIEPIWQTTVENMRGWWKSTFGDPKEGQDAPFMIVTGFVCSTTSGRPTTLKRSGSDYSATLFAKLLGASSVTMWKNVNGVYTADPRMVPAAFPVANMTFDEAMELAYFGGQVLHPSAMVPCIEKRIPVLVRNVFNPAHPGTKVYGRGDEWLRWEDQAEEDPDSLMPVTAITSIEKVALVTLAGASFLGTPGVARRMMEALGNASVNVILTSQGSSEHSITVAVDEKDAQGAEESVKQAFAIELSRDSEIRVTARRNVSILAVIGEGMKKRTGVGGKFFQSLGRAQVNIIAIAQGSSERNISAVVERDELSRALRAAHDGFTLSDMTLAVGIIGSGAVGSELVRQLAKFQGSASRDGQLPAMADIQRLNIEVRALVDAKRMITADHGLPLDKLCEDPDTFSDGGILNIAEWEKRLSSKGKSPAEFLKELKDGDYEVSDKNFDGLEEFMNTKRIPYKVLIDCTASEEVAALYPKWLRKGVNVITPNKRAGAGPMERYEACLKAAYASQAQWRYESTVGAQMPIISLIQDIVQTGDVVHSIEGIFSGTMSVIFALLNDNPGMKFSEAVNEVQARDVMEPDPREDLTGTDTARKTIILARQLGLNCELSDIDTESLLATDISEGCEWDKIMEAVKANDTAIGEKVEAARAKNERLVYVGEIDARKKKIFVGLKSVPARNPLSRVTTAETVCLFITDRYTKDNPLSLHGPGAGISVTASGVFADLLRLSKTLGS